MTRYLGVFGRLLALLTAVLGVITVVMASDPTSGLEILGYMVLILVGFAVSVAVLFWWASRQVEGKRLAAFRGERQTGLALLAAISCLAFAVLGGAKQVRFALSEASLRNAALDPASLKDAARDPQKPLDMAAEPEWIGLYRIYRIDVDESGRVYFDLGECGYGYCQFIYDARNAFVQTHRGWQPAKHWRFHIYEFF